ncbi:MAG: cation:proton antiporter [Nitrospinota bacterium]|nr:cation:proton antiporter [Nitrospinota bacterium]
MDIWTALLDVMILLLAAALLGALFERFRQNAIIGYLLAGALVGPHAFDLMPDQAAIMSIAELGVALLLFMIGLEFSWRRLKNFGVIAIGGGAAQVAVTITITAGLCMTFGLPPVESVIIGAIVALSSTAIVMRILAERTEIDSLHGRSALGILLFQDIAVVPLVLVITLLVEKGTMEQLVWSMGRALTMAIVIGIALYIALGQVIPWALGRKEVTANRDLPVLLAMVVAVGCAWGSHAVGLSPILGAFVGGVILAESPFSIQVRSDVAPLKTLFVTLFFASIGMLTNPGYVLENLFIILALVIAVITTKLLIVTGVLWLFKTPLHLAAATGICLSQVGEFSFVIMDVAHSGGVITGERFEIIIAVIVGTLFFTPYMVGYAPWLGRILDRKSSAPGAEKSYTENIIATNVVIVGFGPAGQAVAEELLAESIPAMVIDLSKGLASKANQMGFTSIVGNATQAEVLHQAKIASCKLVIITVPDPMLTMQVVAQVRSIAPVTHIIARARYSRFHADIANAGADVVIDEEKEVGLQIAAELRRIMTTSSEE